MKTIKAFNKRINACHYHHSKGLKKEPNDTGGPDLAAKIIELQIAIRNAEREKAKAEARLGKLREGGINVDEYIDAIVYTSETNDGGQVSAVARAGGGEAAVTEWPTSEVASDNEQVYSIFCWCYAYVINVILAST